MYPPIVSKDCCGILIRDVEFKLGAEIRAGLKNGRKVFVTAPKGNVNKAFVKLQANDHRDRRKD